MLKEHTALGVNMSFLCVVSVFISSHLDTFTHSHGSTHTHKPSLLPLGFTSGGRFPYSRVFWIRNAVGHVTENRFGCSRRCYSLCSGLCCDRWVHWTGRHGGNLGSGAWVLCSSAEGGSCLQFCVVPHWSAGEQYWAVMSVLYRGAPALPLKFNHLSLWVFTGFLEALCAVTAFWSHLHFILIWPNFAMFRKCFKESQHPVLIDSHCG